jgi:type I restriction-modification system DNA methylase subunit
MNYPSIEIQNLISENLLESLGQENSRHQFAQPESFSCEINSVKENKKNYATQIAEAYENLIVRWDLLSSDFPSMNLSDLREKWVKYFFSQFGFDLQYQKSAIEADSGNKFILTYRGWEGANAPIVHSSSFQQDLDDRLKEQTRKYSPHDTLQRFLNQSNSDLWGIVTNGRYLRILRDFSHQNRKAYIQFDLEILFEGRYHYEDFRILYRLIHPSRFIPKEDEKCILENLFEESKSAGVAIGEDLRKNISSAIESLANGFLLATPDLLNRLVDNTENCMQFYQQILRIIYRVLFLFYAEQRRLMPTRSTLYAQEYSMSSLRDKIERGETIDEEQFDLLEGLKATFNMVYHGVPELGITPYNGQLFNPDSIHWLINSQCRNDKLLMAIKYMSLFEKEGIPHRISYIELNVDEIGAIYESLLEYIPRISSKMEKLGDTNKKNKYNSQNEISPNTFFLDPRGTSRKTSGSYYTHPGLVNALIESALIPVVETKIEEAGPNKDNQEKALLSLKICDPACGSAAFLISATEYLGEKLAKIRIQDDYPNDTQIRHARRDVLRHCIYGVDLNPMAVELAKVSLWLTAATNDLPLNFLDHKIKCGNSLIGATPELIKKGIPPEAYSPVEGDDKNIARERMKITREYYQRKEQERNQLVINVIRKSVEDQTFRVMDLSEKYGEDSTREQKEIEEAYKKSREDYAYKRSKYIADYWTASFFWKHNDDTKNYPTPMMLDYLLKNETVQLSGELGNNIEEILEEYKFFHWHLEFPEVFTNGGFDCVLGNPPWEKSKPNDKEFFAVYSNDKLTMTKSARDKAKIKKELLKDESIFKKYKEYKLRFELYKKFFKFSSRFIIQGSGDVNLYKLFFEMNNSLIQKNSYLGIVLPGGVLGSAGTKEIRSYLLTQANLKIIHFNQWANVFQSVAHKVSLIAFQKNMGDGQFEMTPELMSIEEINRKDFIKISSKLVKKISPRILSLPNIEDTIEILILDTLHKNPVLIEKIQVNREIDMSLDAEHFTNPESGLPIWDGRQIFCLENIPNPKEYIDKDFFYNRFKYENEVKFKTVIRDIIPDSAKKVYASILPKESATSFALRCLTYNKLIDNTYDNHLYLAALLSTYIIEWRVLKLVSDIHLATFLPDVPIPLQIDERVKASILMQAKIIYENKLDDEMRLVRFSEINALVALVYDINYEQLSYIMNYFKTLKKNNIEKFGEYKTKRLILEKYDELKDKFKNL